MTELRAADFLTGLLVGGVLVFVIALVGYLRAVARRKMFLKEMKTTQKSLRELQSGIHSLQVTLRQSQTMKQEPFLSGVKQLEVKLSRLEAEYSAFRDRYLQVKEKIAGWEKMSRLNYLISLLPWSEYNRLIPTTYLFETRIVFLNDHLSEALNLTRTITGLGWEVACQIREGIKKYSECQQIFLELLDHHVHGGYIDEAKAIIDRVSGQISSIPQELIIGSKEEIFNQTEYATICQGYEIFQELSPVIENLHLRINQWWGEYQRTEQTINTCLAALSNAQGLIQESNERIDLGNLQDNLKTIQSIGDILKDTLNRVEIESLPEMVQEAERLNQIANETADAVKQARRNQSILEPLVEQIEMGIHQIDEQVSLLSKHPTFPVVWEETGGRIHSIKSRKKTITVGGRLRSPNEIQDHLATSLALYKNIVELTSHSHQVATNHESLVVAYNTEEIEQGLYWCQEAKRVIETAETYNPANFPKNLSINRLASELEEIQRSHQSLINKLFPNPIGEATIPALLEEMHSLSDRYSVLREQVNEVRSYLTIFHEEINQAREILQRNQPVLNQMISIIRSNSLLSKQGVEKEVDRIRKSLETCTVEVNNTATGSVQNKRVAAMAVEHRVEITCSRWNNYIDKNIEAIRADLREKLEKLDSMANLDDVVIKQARRLLAQTIDVPKSGEKSSGAIAVMENPVLLLKARNDLWQNLMAASSEFEEMIYQPICEAFQEVLTQKELAIKQLEMAAEVVPEKRGWPAMSYVLPTLRANLATIDTVREKNISQPMRSIWWVKRFGEISIKYQEYCRFVVSAVESCKNDFQVINELEQRLDAIEQKWSFLEQQMGSDKITAAKIRALKKEVEQQYKQIKRRWQFSGSVPGMGPSFDQIENALTELVNRFQTAIVVVNDANGKAIEIGIQGQRKMHMESNFSKDMA